MWEPPGAIDLAVPAGTAVLFDRRTWHSAARNFSDVTRKVIFMGYSYRWLRGHDYSLCKSIYLPRFSLSLANTTSLTITDPDWLLDKADPIQRQLLGDSAKVGGHWQPSEFDVPLKGFLDRARGQGAEPASRLGDEATADNPSCTNWMRTNSPLVSRLTNSEARASPSEALVAGGFSMGPAAS